jgi:hypothetical protein
MRIAIRRDIEHERQLVKNLVWECRGWLQADKLPHNSSGEARKTKQSKDIIWNYVRKLVVFESVWNIMFSNKYPNYVIFFLQFAQYTFSI